MVKYSAAEQLAQGIAALKAEAIPAQVRARCEDLLIDVAGLCVAARGKDYMRALVASVDTGGACTAIVVDTDAQGRLNCRPVNACIQFLPTLDGKALFTVEGLRGKLPRNFTDKAWQAARTDGSDRRHGRVP